MADEARASGGRSLTWLWMILALVVVGGFLTWLGMEAEPSAVAVVEEGEGEEEGMPLDSGVVAVPKDTLAANKARYTGQRVQVAQLEATSQLGPTIFWAELGDRANQVPILVRLDSAAAEGWQLQQGASYTVVGEIRRMSDSLATVWGEQGEFAGEGEQMQASFTDYFIQASRIRQSRGGGDQGAARESTAPAQSPDEGAAPSGG